MGAKGHAMAKVMMALDERAPQGPLSWGCHALKPDWLQGGKRRVERG